MTVRFPLYSMVFIASLSAHTAQAELAVSGKTKSGGQVYEEVCAACHDAGVAHAPKFKDKEAWAPLIAEGQDILTAHAWVGVRAMPAQGGSPELKLVEFSRAAAYMASNAGADWKDPDSAMMRKIMRAAEKRLDKSIDEAKAMKKELRRLIQSTR